MKIVTSYQYEQTKLKSLFDQICDEKDWKNPIHCVIPKKAFNDYNETCVHFTGAGLTPKEPFGEMIECASPGYYNNLGA